MSTTKHLQHPTLHLLKQHHPDAGLKAAEFRNQSTVVVPPEHLHQIMTTLRKDPDCNYDFLSDVFGIDYLDYPASQPARFAVVYLLASSQNNLHFRVKTYLDPTIDTKGITPDPALELDSVTDLWPGAEWPERETYDMFGIRFRNHPDLRRILTWEEFPAHPLRKDYPLQGNKERENYKTLTREDA